MLSCSEINDIFNKTGAWRPGHYRLTVRGKTVHTDLFADFRRVLPHHQYLHDIARAIASDFQDRRVEVIVVLDWWLLALGMAIAAKHTHGHPQSIKTICALQDGEGGFSFPSGYEELLPNKTALIVGGVVATGKTLAGVTNLVEKAGGKPVGLAAVCNRGATPLNKLFAEYHTCELCHSEAKLFRPGGSCPHCRNHRPLKPTPDLVFWP